jgi:hypothetical protein
MPRHEFVTPRTTPQHGNSNVIRAQFSLRSLKAEDPSCGGGARNSTMATSYWFALSMKTLSPTNSEPLSTCATHSMQLMRQHEPDPTAIGRIDMRMLTRLKRDHLWICFTLQISFLPSPPRQFLSPAANFLRRIYICRLAGESLFFNAVSNKFGLLR